MKYFAKENTKYLLGLFLFLGLIACGPGSDGYSSSGGGSYDPDEYKVPEYKPNYNDPNRFNKPNFNNPQLRSFSGTAGTCEISKGGIDIGCVEYSYSALLTEDPSFTVTTGARKNCLFEEMGKYNSIGRCNRYGVGFCKISTSLPTTGTRGNATLKRVLVYAGAVNRDDARKICTELSGTFSTTE